MAELTPEQRLAVDTADRPLVLLAGAGSGKTTVLVERYLNLLRRGRKPGEILTVTFTTEAAREMKGRIAKRLQVEGDAEAAASVEASAPIGTLHSFCYTVVESFGGLIGLPPLTGIVTNFDSAERFDQVFRDWLASLAPSELRFLGRHFGRGTLRGLFQSLYAKRYALARSLAHQPADAPETELVGKLGALANDFSRRLDREFLQRGLYGFDDLEQMALRILTESPDALARLRARFKHFLVDEFQDTSPVQWEILRLLLGDDWNKLFVVGDPKQSIYGFREADYRLFLEVARQMDYRGGEVRELSTNFRSQPALVEAVNHASAGLFAGTDIPFSPMQAGREQPTPTAPVRLVRFCGGEKRSDSSVAEAQALVADLAKRLAQGETPCSIAVLFRVSDRMPFYAEELRRAGIPVAARRTVRLFERYAALDIANYLELLADPLDDLRLAAFLRSPYVGLSTAELQAMVLHPADCWLDRCAASADGRLEWFLRLVDSGAFDVQSALTALFRHGREFPEDGEVLLALLDPLAREPLTVLEAARRLRAWAREEILVSREEATDGPGVQLLTVHGAKGLEWPHVYLADLLRASSRRTPALRFGAGQAPGIRYLQGTEAVTTPAYDALAEEATLRERDESKRVLYVALTRARDSLSILLPDLPECIPKNSWGEILETVYGNPGPR